MSCVAAAAALLQIPVVLVIDPAEDALSSSHNSSSSNQHVTNNSSSAANSSAALARALAAGAAGTLQRPLLPAALAATLGGALRRCSVVESAYKDLVGEVQRFRYPQFQLGGFTFQPSEKPGAGAAGGNDAELLEGIQVLLMGTSFHSHSMLNAVQCTAIYYLLQH
jgi:hypothetical protein